MAIVVEEDRGSGTGIGSGIVSVLVWLGILGIIAATVYYVFVAQPELVEYAVPANFTNTEQIIRVNIDPGSVLQDARFANLKQYVTLPEEPPFGRTNPFIGFENLPPTGAKK